MNRKRKSQWEKGFEAGMLWAIAQVADAHGLPEIAGELLRASGADPRNCDQADAEGVAQAVHEVEIRRQYTEFVERGQAAQAAVDAAIEGGRDGR